MPSLNHVVARVALAATLSALGALGATPVAAEPRPTVALRVYGEPSTKEERKQVEDAVKRRLGRRARVVTHRFSRELIRQRASGLSSRALLRRAAQRIGADKVVAAYLRDGRGRRRTLRVVTIDVPSGSVDRRVVRLAPRAEAAAVLARTVEPLLPGRVDRAASERVAVQETSLRASVDARRSTSIETELGAKDPDEGDDRDGRDAEPDDDPPVDDDVVDDAELPGRDGTRPAGDGESRPTDAVAPRPDGEPPGPAPPPTAPRPTSPTPQPGPATPRRELMAAWADRAPSIDGKLDDALWTRAPVASDFMQISPVERAPASERTEVRIAYDETHLYVAARLHDREVGSVQRHLSRRDQETQADSFGLSLDSLHSRRTAYRFEVNAAGIQRDLLLHSDAEEDSRWDAVWDSAVSHDEDGWTVELAIPVSQLRAEGGVPRWGLQMTRFVFRNRETSAWQFVPANQGVNVSAFGDLSGLGRLTPRTAIELRPYVASGVTVLPGGGADPYRSGEDFTFKAGGDLRYSPAPNWTVNGTVNPDFGQVETDPALVNLGDAQLFFPEQRPFFLEGLDVFAADIPQPIGNDPPPTSIFYSRRIGAAPTASAVDPPPDAVYSSTAIETPIYGALKLTGRTAGGLSIGLLDAVTAPVDQTFARDDGTVIDGEERLIQPLTNYSVVRLDQQFGDGSKVGVVGVSANRDLEEGLDSQLTSAAYAGGGDWNIRFGEKSNFVAGKVLGSHVRGDPAVIRGLETNFTRYLQRPDADHLAVDGDASSMTGWLAELTGGRSGDATLNFDVTTRVTSPRFEVNDTGFQNRADELAVRPRVIVQDKEPGDTLRSWSLIGTFQQKFNLAFDPQPSGSVIDFDALTTGFVPMLLSVAFIPPAYDDRLLRGGPSAASELDMGFFAKVGTDVRRRFRLDGFANLGGSLAGGRDVIFGANFNAEPIPALTLSLSPFLYLRTADAQYVDVYMDEAATDTYGSRYIFATLKETQTSLSLRAEWTFSPTLGFQTVVRAAASAARFQDYKFFAEPRTRTFDPTRPMVAADDDLRLIFQAPGSPATTTIDRPDFLFSSLQTNAVLRWEYLPGSTAFAVYQLSCQSQLPEREFRASAYGDPCGGQTANHTFLVKLSYFWSP